MTCERDSLDRLRTMSVFGYADAPIVVELAQNQIYKAFREVGRVMRSVVLLRFLADSGCGYG